MTSSTNDSGGDALQREIHEAAAEETRRADRLTRRWRRFVRNLRDLAEQPND